MRDKALDDPGRAMRLQQLPQFLNRSTTRNDPSAARTAAAKIVVEALRICDQADLELAAMLLADAALVLDEAPDGCPEQM